MKPLRTMSFDPAAMEESRGQSFTEICRVIAGITGNAWDSLLSILPSELAFNDLRDSGRRSAKSERTVPQNVHAVAHKSSCNRSSGGKPLSSPESKVHQELRPLHAQGDRRAAGCML